MKTVGNRKRVRGANHARLHFAVDFNLQAEQSGVCLKVRAISKKPTQFDGITAHSAPGFVAGRELASITTVRFVCQPF